MNDEAMSEPAPMPSDLRESPSGVASLSDSIPTAETSGILSAVTPATSDDGNDIADQNPPVDSAPQMSSLKCETCGHECPSQDDLRSHNAEHEIASMLLNMQNQNTDHLTDFIGGEEIVSGSGDAEQQSHDDMTDSLVLSCEKSGNFASDSSANDASAIARRSARKRKRSVRTISPTALDIRARPRPDVKQRVTPMLVKPPQQLPYHRAVAPAPPVTWQQQQPAVVSQPQPTPVPAPALSAPQPQQQAYTGMVGFPQQVAMPGAPPVHLVGGSCIYCGFEIKKPWDLVTHMVEQHDVQISSLDCGDALPLEAELTCPFCAVLFTIAHDLFYHLLIGHAKKIFGREAMSDYCTIEMLTVDHKKLTLKVRINRKNPLVPGAGHSAAQQLVQGQLAPATSSNEIIIRGQLGIPDAKVGNLVAVLPGIQGLTSMGGGGHPQQTVSLAGGSLNFDAKTLQLSTPPGPGGRASQVYALQPQTSPGGTTTYHLVPSTVVATSSIDSAAVIADSQLTGGTSNTVPSLDASTIASITEQLQQEIDNANAASRAGASHSTVGGGGQPGGGGGGAGGLYKVVKGAAKNPIHIVGSRSRNHDITALDIPANLVPEAESHVRLHDKGPICRFQCSQCFKVRESKEDAITHVYKVHMCAALRRFQCSYCPKCYDNMKNLQTHVNACHAPTRMYACPTCPMKYKYPGDLKRHLSKNVCDRHKSGGFPCPKCGMMWYHQSALASHQRQCDGIQ